MTKKQVSIAQLKEDLSNGLSRLKKQDFGKGSIEEKYGLTPTQVTLIFKHPDLKGLKVKGKKRKKVEEEIEIVG